MTLEAWLGAHPYLRPLGALVRRGRRPRRRDRDRPARVPAWDDYAADFRAGVPLLRSDRAGVDLEPGGSDGRRARRAAGRERRRPGSSPRLARSTRRSARRRRRRAASWTGCSARSRSRRRPRACSGSSAGPRWRVTSRPVVDRLRVLAGRGALASRATCPTCGSPPAMAQLIGATPGAMRFLSCGCCGTRWQLQRTTCPFCESDSQRLDGRRRRRRSRAAHRLLRDVPRLPQDVRRAGRRGASCSRTGRRSTSTSSRRIAG